MRVERVRKRDGREVLYDRAKIAGAVARAEAAVGDRRAGFSDEVAQLVETFLERRFVDPSRAVPGIEEIQDLVERALVEMGAAAVAKAYILYRERRARAREALVVREPASDETPGPAGRGPRVEARDGAPAWSKGRIVAALMGETDLPRARAEEVAALVEEHVFGSGLKSISTGLVRELVDHALVELGCEVALRRHRPIGIPRHDLRRLLLDPAAAGDGRSVEHVVAGEILGRFAAEDLLPPSVADRMRAGEIEIEDLARPHLPLSLSVHSESLAPRSDLQGADCARAALPEIGRLAVHASESLVLEGFEPFLVGDRSAVAGWLAALGGVAAASGRSLELAVDGALPGVLASVLPALAGQERDARRGALPRVRVGAAALARLDPALRRDAERLLATGLLLPAWSAEGETSTGTGRGERETGAITTGAVLALDLPRLARLAGPWREDRLLEALAERIEIGIQGLVALRDFQRGCASPDAPRARVRFDLAPVGVAEALAVLGDGEVRGDHAGRLLAFLGEAADRLGADQGIRLAPSLRPRARAGARFARKDGLEFRTRQRWLFEAPGIASDLDRPYAAVLEGIPESALLALLGSVPSGALEPPTVLPALAAARPEVRDLPLLAALERLDRRRGRTRGGPHALFAVPSLLPRPGAQAEEPAPDLFASVPAVP